MPVYMRHEIFMSRLVTAALVHCLDPCSVHQSGDRNEEVRDERSWREADEAEPAPRAGWRLRTILRWALHTCM